MYEVVYEREHTESGARMYFNGGTFRDLVAVFLPGWEAAADAMAELMNEGLRDD